MVLRFKCMEQRLICENSCALAANSINHVSCAFTLDAGWNGYVITAVFENASGAYNVLLDGAKSCFVPAEVLCEGSFSVALMGVKSDDEQRLYRITAAPCRIDVLCGPCTEGENAGEPTPTQMEQALIYLCEARELAQGNSVPVTVIRQAINDYLAENPIQGGGAVSAPVKGVDYWTDSDKGEMISELGSALTLSREQTTLRLMLDDTELARVELRDCVGVLTPAIAQNTVILEGLDAGSYTLKYENAPEYGAIGNVEVT